jgi:hypothetical protein
MRINDGIKVRGDVVVTVRDAVTGARIRRFEIRNTITNLGLGVLVQLLSQRSADPTGKSLSVGFLLIGNGTNAPAVTDVAMGDSAPAVLTLVDGDKTPTISGPYQLTFAVTAGTGVGNGKTLTEAGLWTVGTGSGFSGSSQLVARQLNPAIAKTSAIVVDYVWSISFSV